jgi:hypothetical protein
LVVAANFVWPVTTRQGVVEVNVVGFVASARGCGSVASGWLWGVGLVQSHFGGCREVVVGKWSDFLNWCLEPSASPFATSGIVDSHCSVVKVVGVGIGVVFLDQLGELFLLVFGDVGVRRDFGEIGP